jgi:hypothetical protein
LEGKMGKRERAPSRCHVTVEGGGASVTRRERLTDGTGDSRARWQ